MDERERPRGRPAGRQGPRLLPAPSARPAAGPGTALARPRPGGNRGARAPARFPGLPAFLAMLLLPGCMITPQRTELGPFYYHRPLPDTPGTESALLWPFFQRIRSERVSQFAVRPVFNYRISETEGIRGRVREIQALWPLFLHRTSEGMNASRTRLYPILFHHRFNHPGGETEVDTFVLPLIFTGRDGNQGRYFGLFPLGGVLKGIFGRDRIRFALFPLYADSRIRGHRTWNVLWPIFEYSQGDNWRSFRVFPFVSWKKRDNWFEKLYILWPFFGRVQEWLSTERATDSWFFLPFYARQQTPFGYVKYYLYPFFSYQRSENPGNRFKAWEVPWPFLSFMRGDNFHKNYFWPFWGRGRFKQEYRKDFAAYPIYRFYSYRTDVSVNTRLFVLPFYWDKHVSDFDGNLLGRRDKVWPFLDLAWSRQTGAFRLRTLSPLWFRDPEGFERNYGDFYTLYTREVHLNGLLDQKILWYRWYRATEESRDTALAEGKSEEEAAAVPPASNPLEGPDRGGAGDDSWTRRMIRQLRDIGLWPDVETSP